MTILYCIGSAIIAWYFTWLYYKPERQEANKNRPHVIEKHWVGFVCQKRLHYKHIHDYISEN